MKTTKEEMASRLTGREYGDEIDRDEERIAKESGLFVIFGASCDLVEIRGISRDEAGVCDGGTFRINRFGIMSDPDDNEEEVLTKFGVLEQVQRGGVKIQARWCAEPGYSWTYKTDIRHATFEIVEDGEPYCRGIVIDVSDLTEA